VLCLERKENNATAAETFDYLYFAGRPVAQYKTTNSGDTLTYLHADHLGTPFLATNDSGTLIWQGPFEPFGQDWTGAIAAEIFLRFPGQWDDGRWSSADEGADVYFNVHRWYEHATGRYARSDPLGRKPLRISTPGTFYYPELYLFANGNPTKWIDFLGLSVCSYSVGSGCLSCVSDDGTQRFGTCDTWSGQGKCRNDPKCESLVSRGPIPRGEWETGCAGCTPPHKTPRVPIKPIQGPTQTFGRGPFQFQPGIGPNSSEGCIVMRPDLYKKFLMFYKKDDGGKMSVKD
jgi:RHS repeat-associated protein